MTTHTPTSAVRDHSLAAFAFQARPIGAITTLAEALAGLSSPIDSYLEDQIRSAQFHALVDNATNQAIGHVAIHKGMRLTHFYLQPSVRRYAQPLYRAVIQHFALAQALVPTCDEFFLSHALDEYVELHKQAYFFVAGAPVGPWADRVELHFQPATMADCAATAEFNGGFVDQVPARIARGEIHLGRLDGALVALGIVERGQLLPDCASIGMMVAPAQRQQGIGTRMIRYLRSVCEQNGLQPLAGCGYDNVLSKRTLEAAGMVTATRLLRVTYAA